MAGVTGGDDTDLQAIMNGDANFVARVTAFYKAKQEANDAIKKYVDIMEYTQKRDEVMAVHAKIAADKKEAEEEAQRVRGDAGRLSSQMTSEAAAIMARARSDAKDILAAADKQAAETRADAQGAQIRADVAASAIEARSKELIRQEREFSDKQKKLDAAIAASNESKDKYDAKYATLAAALAAQG